MTTSATPHLFWITSRAAGIAALVLASLAVCLGLLMSTKLLRKRGPDLVATHEILSLATIVAIVVHGAALLGDAYMHPSIVDISIPFVSGYKTAWTTVGIISGWGLALLGLSYYARRRIGAARWRKLHRFTAVAWLAGLVHALGEGTDAGQGWFLAMIAIVTVPALILLATRLGRSAARPPAASNGRAPTGSNGRPPTGSNGRQPAGSDGRPPAGSGRPQVGPAPTRTPLSPARAGADIRAVPAGSVPTAGVAVRSWRPDPAQGR